MNRIISNYIEKLFFKKWIIGIFRADIKDIIRSKTFDPYINWLLKKSSDAYYADPFLLLSKNENLKILLEDFSFDKDYGRISLMTLDKSFNQLSQKILLDTKSHISYPFVFTENNKTYIFPEAGRSGKLSCYEYDPLNESIDFLQDIVNLPLCDSSILKHGDKYWIFATISDIDAVTDAITDYKVHVFFSDNLLGPYISHPGNPVKSGLNGTRQAGNFIEVDGIIYRPTQNCKRIYGESITINKVTELNELNVAEEPYLNININRKKRSNYGMHTIHTINVMDDIIVVDGTRWIFSPLIQINTYLRNKRKAKLSKQVKIDYVTK
jgi:hypothetical protein